MDQKFVGKVKPISTIVPDLVGLWAEKHPAGVFLEQYNPTTCCVEGRVSFSQLSARVACGRQALEAHGVLYLSKVAVLSRPSQEVSF